MNLGTVQKMWEKGVGDAQFSVLAYGYSQTCDRIFVERHPREDDWLFLHFFDAVEVPTAGGLQRVPPPSFMFWPPGQPRSYGNATSAWRHSWLHVRGTGVPAIMAETGFSPSIPHPMDAEPITADFLLALHREILHELTPSPRILRNLFENWLVALTRKHVGARGGVPERIAMARQKLDDGSAAWLSLERLAALSGLSPSHFHSEFRRHVGKSPGRYQQERRIDRAMHLLSVKGTTATLAAEHLGFADVFSFSRSFKKIVGKSPSAWIVSRDR